MTGICALSRWLIGLVTVALCLASPASAATIRLTLEKGQVLTWDCKTSLQETETGGQPKPSDEITMPITLRVIDRTQDGYLLEIQNGRTEFDPQQTASKSDTEVLEVLRVLETLKLQFLVTRDGGIKDIVNFDEVRAAGRKMIEMGRQNNADDREMELLMFEQFAGSKESLKHFFLKDADLMLYGTNVDPEMKKPVDFETEVQDAFGIAPLKMTGQLSLRSVDLKSKLAEIHVEQQADQQSLIQLSIKNYARLAGKEPPRDVLETMMQNGSMRDAIDVTINLDSRLATHAKRVRTSVNGSTVRIDQLELTLKK